MGGHADKAQELVTAIHCADHMAHAIGADLWNSEVVYPLWDDACSTLGIDQDEYTACCDELKEHVDKSIEFLTMIDYAE